MTPREHHDDLTKSSVSDYLVEHSKQNGGWKEFLRSNLFSALVIFLLGQAILLGVAISSSYWRTGQLLEWKGETTATLKRMDDQGTNNSHYRLSEIDKQMAELMATVKKMQEATEHFDVMESENRRITKDVEELKDAEKHRSRP